MAAGAGVDQEQRWGRPRTLVELLFLCVAGAGVLAPFFVEMSDRQRAVANLPIWVLIGRNGVMGYLRIRRESRSGTGGSDASDAPSLP